MWNLESWAVESGIPLAITIQNPSSTVKDWNAVTWNPESTAGIQNLRLSWIPLHGAKLLLNSKPQYKEVHCGQFFYGV